MPVNIKNKLFETRDYSIFKRARGNRPVDKGHVAQLKKLIADKDIGDPVKVNRALEVIDGQHTLLGPWTVTLAITVQEARWTTRSVNRKWISGVSL